MVSEAVTGVLIVVMVLGLIGWLVIMAYWMLGRMGLWKWATYRRLKKRYKNLEFKEEVLDWCLDKIERKWRYKDIRRFLSYSKDSGETFYTFMTLTKLPKEALDVYFDERRLQDNGRQTDRGIEKETGRTLPETLKEKQKS